MMRAVLLTLTLLSVATVSAQQAAPPQPAVRPAPRPVPTKVVSEEAGFSATLPCEPEPSNATVPGHVQFECTSADGFYALVAALPIIVLDEPTAELDTEVALSIQSSPQAQVLSQEPIAFDRYDGRLLRVKIGNDTLITSRLYLVPERNRLYRIVTVVAADNAMPPEAAMKSFVDSFALTAAPPADVRPAAITARLASKMNKSLPLAIDDSTELLFTTGIQGVLAYHYRLSTLAVADIVVDRFLETMKAAVVRGTCQGPVRTNLLDGNVVMRHIYLDKDLQQIGILNISKADCAAAPQ